VTDWPLAELERYKAKRPHIYAQMKTRLMTVTPRARPPTSQECARLRALRAEGKVQQLPPECAGPLPPSARLPQLPSPAVVSKPAGVSGSRLPAKPVRPWPPARLPNAAT
jgi:hypothetical protein